MSTLATFFLPHRLCWTWMPSFYFFQRKHPRIHQKQNNMQRPLWFFAFHCPRQKFRFIWEFEAETTDRADWLFKFPATKMESETLRNFLECPICTRLPSHRVFTCPNGHNLCEDCYHHLQQQRPAPVVNRQGLPCPSCKDPFSHPPTRNRLAESLIVSAKLPEVCSYHHYGCTFQGRSKKFADLLSSMIRECRGNFSAPHPSLVQWAVKFVKRIMSTY